MEYENAEENAKYLQACENVKKIANAIKKIKMKYYTNFAKITNEDKEVYEGLEEELEKISSENNLENLKIALMREISNKYDQKELRGNENDPNSVDERLLACYGNIDVQQEALSVGKIGQARQCQQILQQYLDEIGIDRYRIMVNNYKREKFAELVIQRAIREEKNKNCMEFMKGCYKDEDEVKRKKAQENLKEATRNEMKQPEYELQLG